jgi:hypothetical protein
MLVGHLLADVGDLGAHLEHDPLDAALDRKIATRHTPRRRLDKCGQRDTGDLIDQGIDIGSQDQLALTFQEAPFERLCLDRDMGGVGFCAWRLSMFIAQMPDVAQP